MRLVFTGFEPFGELAYNPSWDVAQAAARASSAQAHLLPVTLATARKVVELIDDDTLLVCVGVAATRATVCLERYAHNWWMDVEDQQPVRLDLDGPVARECGLPLDDWAPRLDGCVSHDAGNYVCNATLYYSLAETPNAMFVHVPIMGPGEAGDLGEALADLLGDVGI